MIFEGARCLQSYHVLDRYSLFLSKVSGGIRGINLSLSLVRFRITVVDMVEKGFSVVETTASSEVDN